MAFSDYSSTPASNTTIAGINIAEGCPAGNINGAVRQLMADAKDEHDALPDLADYVLLDGTAAFTGQPTYSGRGAFIHHNNSANTSGRIFIQASGGTAPSMSNGDLLLEY
jgi:hypothetical protein